MTSTQQPQERPDDLDPLNISSPPWWDLWEAWQAQRDPDTSRFIEERDPREKLNDDLAYELAVEAFGGGFEALLSDLATRRSEWTMAQRVLELRRQWHEHQERTRGT